MYQTFSEMFSQAGTLTGELNDKASEAALKFYLYWGNYLDTVPAFLSFLYKPLGMLAKGMYFLTNSLEHVFNNMFKLLGLFGYLEDKQTIIGQFYSGFQKLGIGLFVVLLIARVLIGVVGKSPKYKEIVTHFLLVTIVTAVLPMAVTKISQTLATDLMNVETVESTNGKSTNHFSSLAIQPMKNNVVDLKVLIDHDFDIRKFPMDSQRFIQPVKENRTSLNNITDSASKADSPDYISHIDFSASFGAITPDLMVDTYGQDDKEYGEALKGLFLHRINDMGTGVVSITEHKLMKGLNAFEPVYPRYKVNWLGMLIQYLILIVLLVMMSVKVVKSVFETVLTAIIAPIQGYTSVESSKKFKELLMTILSAFAGIFFEMIILRIMLEFMRDLPTLALNGVSGLSGDFFDGLNMWEQCITSIIVYLGVFFGAMQGVTVIERWLGVSTGHSDTMQQVIGGMMMANMGMQGAKGLAHSIGALGAGGMALAKNAPNLAKGLGNSIAKAGGGLSGAFDAVKEQGLKGAMQAGMANAGETVGSKATGLSNTAMNALDQSTQSGYDTVKSALTPHTPYGSGQLEKQTNESLQRSIRSSSDEAKMQRRNLNEAKTADNKQNNVDSQLFQTEEAQHQNAFQDSTGNERTYGVNETQNIQTNDLATNEAAHQTNQMSGLNQIAEEMQTNHTEFGEPLQGTNASYGEGTGMRPHETLSEQGQGISVPNVEASENENPQLDASDSFNGLHEIPSSSSSVMPETVHEGGLNTESNAQNMQTNAQNMQTMMPDQQSSISDFGLTPQPQIPKTPPMTEETTGYQDGVDLLGHSNSNFMSSKQAENNEGSQPKIDMPQVPTPPNVHSVSMSLQAHIDHGRDKENTLHSAKQSQRQKASLDFQKMQMNLQQSMQYMAGSKSHIRGVDLEDE